MEKHILFIGLLNGPIPYRMLVCHTCDNPRCCNPEHLFLGTDQTNADDKMIKNRHHCFKLTHCPHGHEYTAQNTYTKPNGHRTCRTCNRKRNKESKEYKANWYIKNKERISTGEGRIKRNKRSLECYYRKKVRLAKEALEKTL